MTNIIGFFKDLAIFLPFLLLVFLNKKTNLKKPFRSRQFLMPVLSLIYCILVIIFLNKIYELISSLFTMLQQRINNPTFDKIIEQIFESGVYFAFFAANMIILFAYIIYKRICITFLKGIFKKVSSFHDAIANLFYEQDEESGNWYLKKNCLQARTFLRTFYVAAIILSMIGMALTGRLYLNDLLASPWYPVFFIIPIGELFFFIDGDLKKKKETTVAIEEIDEEEVIDYSLMRKVLKKLFKDKLSTDNTTVDESETDINNVEKLIDDYEASPDLIQASYGRFMRRVFEQGVKIDRNYAISGNYLLHQESVLFNNPFFYDMIPYVSYPMNRTLLRHKKVLIILGRHGSEEEAIKWVKDGFEKVNHIDGLWKVGVLTDDEKQELDVGIISRSDVHNLRLHEARHQFFEETEFVMLMEPSRLITTAQIGLNSIVRYCRLGMAKTSDNKLGRKIRGINHISRDLPNHNAKIEDKRLVFCSADKNCDGLLDALSHILMTSLKEVTATEHHTGVSSYMVWDADNAHLQHRLMPNLSRYLGMGTELSFVALKNHIKEVSWYGGEAFPVTDVRWIASQYYYDLLHYAELPAIQSEMDKVFKVSPELWSAKIEPNSYITVEDESCNMFEVRRNFATRAMSQGFINIISPSYMLKDYMAGNESILATDAKAIPYIAADYSHTVRNVVLRLCLRMSTGSVPENDLVRELTLISQDTSRPADSLWHLICDVLGERRLVEKDIDGEEHIVLGSGKKAIRFSKEVIFCKKKFSFQTGTMVNHYFITDKYFKEFALRGLVSAEYIAEDENQADQYLGAEVEGLIFQKYLPGQFFTFAGKYYEMMRVTLDGKVVVRRASDHINGRVNYRQVREYTLTDVRTSEVMGDVRDRGDMCIEKQYADIKVATPAYWDLPEYHDFRNGRKVTINGIPERSYCNKPLLKITFKREDASPETVATLALLMQESMRTLLAENACYLSVVSAYSMEEPVTYSLHGEDLDPLSIYIIEDSQLDIGLLDAVSRNIDRILGLVCEYLTWNEKAIEESKKPSEEGPYVDYSIPEDEQEDEEEPKKKENIFKRIWEAIKRFFKKLFGKKAKKNKTPDQGDLPVTPDVPEIPVDPEVPVDDMQEPISADMDAEAVPEANEDAPEEETTGDTETTDVPEVPFEVAMDDSDDLTEEEEREDFEVLNFSILPENAFASEMPDTEDALAPVDQKDEEGGSSLEFEKERLLKLIDLSRKPYYERYYLLYGGLEKAKKLDLEGVKSMLISMGYGDSSMQQAREGLTTAEAIERSDSASREGKHYCDFCGRELSVVQYDILSDGRERCTTCGRTAIKDIGEFEQIYRRVIRNLKMFYGVRITVPVKIQMVNAKKLHKKLNKTFIPTGSFDGRVLGVAIRNRKGEYTILMENGAPSLMSTMTMVHELTHIWQYTNWDEKQILKLYGQEQNLEIYEGMAKWAEIQYAYLINEPGCAKREEIETLMRDDEYGRGFVKYCSRYPLRVGADMDKDKKTPFTDPARPL